MSKNKNGLRTETKLGIFFFIIFGLLHTLFMGPEIVKGFFAALGASLIIVGTLSEERYKRLKMFKKKIIN